MATEEISAVEAALEAARLGLIGTVTVGILATLGTLAGTVLAPFLIRRSETKSAAAERRRGELADIVPQVIAKGALGAGPGASVDSLVSSMEAHARLGVLLRPEEWQIAIIAREGLLAGDGGHAARQAAGTAAQVIPMWARGEISSAEAAAIYEHETGTPIMRVTVPGKTDADPS